MRKLNLAQLQNDLNVIKHPKMYSIKGGGDPWTDSYLYNMYETDFCEWGNDPTTDTPIPPDNQTYNGGMLPEVVINGGSGGHVLPEVVITDFSPFSKWNLWTDSLYEGITNNSSYNIEPMFGININNVSNSSPSISPVNLALSYIQSLVDHHTPYRQENGILRTANTPQALAYMDCSELVCRYLAQMRFISDNVQSMNSLAIREYAENNPSMLSRISNDSPPQAGDIFLWHRSDYDGHTGIVKSYDANIGMVTILEEYSYGDVHEAREIEYGINSNALRRHEGWEGFYRPNVD
jgi:hypothetical protein